MNPTPNTIIKSTLDGFVGRAIGDFDGDGRPDLLLTMQRGKRLAGAPLVRIIPDVRRR